MTSRLIKEWKAKENPYAAKRDMLNLEQIELTEKNMGLNKTFVGPYLYFDIVMADNFWSVGNP